MTVILPGVRRAPRLLRTTRDLASTGAARGSPMVADGLMATDFGTPQSVHWSTELRPCAVKAGSPGTTRPGIRRRPGDPTPEFDQQAVLHVHLDN